MRHPIGTSAITITALSAVLALSLPADLRAGPYFEDGLLGLTQAELHEKLGRPQAVRNRKSALRIFTYYPVTDWNTYFSKMVSPENGEDVYTFSRDGIDVRYSFSYAADPNDHRENRPLIVRLVDIEFSTPVPLVRLPSLVPEFRPSSDAATPAFRSNLWILLFKGPPAEEARFIVKETTKDRLDWTLSFQLFSLQGLPEHLTPLATIDRMEIGAQSVQLVRNRQRHTHEPILNPYSQEFTQQPVAPSPTTKPVPVPQYAE